MKTSHKTTFLAGLLLAVLAGGPAFGVTTIISDNYDVTTSGTGFALGEGVNTGITPPTTRLTGTAAANLRYLQRDISRPASQYSISGNTLKVAKDSNSGRFTLSADGVTPFDFSQALGVQYATPGSKAIYDLKISMQKSKAGTQRFSLAIGTVEGNANTWDFGVQVYCASTSATKYTLRKRVDKGSYNGATTSDDTDDINAAISGTYGTQGTMLDILIRVTDAGAETGADYHSRVRVSLDAGSTWVYDSNDDTAVQNHWRFDGHGRYIMFDQAGNNNDDVFYDEGARRQSAEG